jgi:thioredoxin reductase (NADPH)
MIMEKIYDVVIIGSGPAGMSAAIYTKRANLNVLLLDSNAPGGKLLVTNIVENYPGIADATGIDLSLQMYEQINRLKIDFDTGRVEKIINGDIKKIILQNDEIIQSKTIIIATGTSEKKLGILGEDRYRGYGISYCAVCDGALFKETEIVVIGSGNSALEESVYLTEFVKKIHLLVRKDEFKGDQIAQDRVFENKKIQVYFNTSLIEILGDDKHVTGIKAKDKITEKEFQIDVKGIFPLIGAVPSTSFIKNFDILNAKGYIIVNDKMETSLAGIYGAGDVCQKSLRQIVTATNDGAIAAQEVYKYINK